MNNLAQKSMSVIKGNSTNRPVDSAVIILNTVHTNEERLHGLDPGCFDPNKLENMSEAEFWLEIFGQSGIIKQLSRPTCFGKELHANITEQVFAIEFLSYQFCIRAGIEVAEPSSFRHIEPGPEFRKWQQFYQKHFKEILSPEELTELQEIRKNKGDISKFLPKGTWRD